MIARGLQMYHTGAASVNDEGKILFNTIVQSWAADGIPAITQSSGTFTILNASLSDYLITWQIALKTSFSFFKLGTNFRFQSYYPNDGLGGDNYTIGGGCSNTMKTCSLHGSKLLHIIRKSSPDTLTFSINNNYIIGTAYLSTIYSTLPTFLDKNMIANASITIISI